MLLPPTPVIVDDAHIRNGAHEQDHEADADAASEQVVPPLLVLVIAPHGVASGGGESERGHRDDGRHRLAPALAEQVDGGLDRHRCDEHGHEQGNGEGLVHNNSPQGGRCTGVRGSAHI